MNIVHITYYDVMGGAARAAWRLHSTLKGQGVESSMIVKKKGSDAPEVRAQERVDDKLRQLFLRRANAKLLSSYRTRPESHFNPAWYSQDIRHLQALEQASVVHLHWLSGEFFSYRRFGRLRTPVVWTLHDLWPLTGGCHYTGTCNRYREACGACPALDSDDEEDLSRQVWVAKQHAYAGLPQFAIVATSRWLADCARASPLSRNAKVAHIPLGLDTEVFVPCDRSEARRALGLAEEGPIVLFGTPHTSEDRRKGFDLLQVALRELSQGHGGPAKAADPRLVLFGRDEAPPGLPLPCIPLGRFDDDRRLALVYAAADVMVVPSREEAFGQTASEALACGTPVVSFDIDGLRDIVDHRENGYRARPFDTADLAGGIAWVLEQGVRLREQARRKAEREYTLDLMGRRHRDLYAGLLSPA